MCAQGTDLEEFKWRFSYINMEGLKSELSVTDEIWSAFMTDLAGDNDGKISYDDFKSYMI